MSLWGDIEQCLEDLEKTNELARKLGCDKTHAEAAYYSAKARAAFQMKEDGLSAAFINMVLKGTPEVSKAMTEYHIAEIEYDNARECVNVLKKKLTALNDQYSREWSQAGTRG